MQCRGSLVVIFLATSSIIHTTVYGQSPLAEDGLYCSAGLHPDGYIDFSGLPPAPNSAALTATLPVQGVPGLTVTVTIPALYGVKTGTTQAYSVNGGTLQLNGLPKSSTGTVLILSFNQPIAGVGLNTETSGRFRYSYTLQVGVPPNETPSFLTMAQGYTVDLFTRRRRACRWLGCQVLRSKAPQCSLRETSTRTSRSPTSECSRVQRRIQEGGTDKRPATMAAGRSGLAAADGAAGGAWLDQSGQGHNATPSAIPPFLTADGRNCQPAWQFTGQQAFSFNVPIAGWSEMTVFLVAKAENGQGPSNSFAGNSAISWIGDEPWGNTFVSPYQGNVYARFGTTQAGNTLFYCVPAPSGRTSAARARCITTAATACL